MTSEFAEYDPSAWRDSALAVQPPVRRAGRSSQRDVAWPSLAVSVIACVGMLVMPIQGAVTTESSCQIKAVRAADHASRAMVTDQDYAPPGYWRRVRLARKSRPPAAPEESAVDPDPLF